jgi:hypothetical protein
MFVRTLLAASDVWGRLLFHTIATAAAAVAALVCLFVMLFMVIGPFIAALAACL